MEEAVQKNLDVHNIINKLSFIISIIIGSK